MRQQAARRDPPAVAELSGIEPLGALSKLTRLARVLYCCQQPTRPDRITVNSPPKLPAS